MDRYLLKNIMIIILVLVNGFLLGALTVRQTAEDRSRRQAEEQLVELFAADSITLDPDAISDEVPPTALSCLRSTEREREAAVFFLGEELTEENQGGGISTYSGTAGTATFRSNGSFDIRGTLSTKNTESFCEAFCRTFSYGQPVFLVDQDGSGSGSAVYLHNKLLVFNCTVTHPGKRGPHLRQRHAAAKRGQRRPGIPATADRSRRPDHFPEGPPGKRRRGLRHHGDVRLL